MPQDQATVGIIGGSGLYSLFSDGVDVELDTPFGPPSGPITLASIGGVQAAFLPRHGVHHQWPPHRINYRANVWALKELGVRRVLAPAAVGGLAQGLGPGSLVVPDQIVDWTTGRDQTFHDEFGEAPLHASFADPFCGPTRTVLLHAAAQAGWAPVDGGAMVVIDGPRFSSRAESLFFQNQGWSVINMTGHPEAVLCREAGLCYASLALVTDIDAGTQVGDGVTVEKVLVEFARNTERLRALLLDAAIAADQLEPDSCSS